MRCDRVIVAGLVTTLAASAGHALQPTGGHISYVFEGLVQPTDGPTMDDADNLFSQAEWAEAAKAYESVLKANPDQQMGWFRLGYAYHALGELDKALPAHRKAAEMGGQIAPIAQYNIGCAYALQGKTDAAFKALAKAREMGFSDNAQFSSDTDLKSLRDDPRWARLLAGKPLTEAPAPVAGPVPTMADADALFNQAEWAKAAKAYEQVLKANANQPGGWFRLGYAYHALGELDKALPAHKKAASMGGQFAPVAQYNIGCAYALQGKTDAAFEALAKSRAMGFTDNAQYSGDSDLKSLRDDARWKKLLADEALGAEAPATAAAPSGAPTETNVYRQFDFWIGEWDVYNKDGKKLGENSIKVADRGHVILESWKAVNGGSGTSINYYHPASKQWKQVWVDGGGNVLEMAGTFSDGAMRFNGKQTYRDGRTELHRTMLVPMADGRVRQAIQQSRDEGATWYDWFEGFYVRKGAPVETKQEF